MLQFPSTRWSLIQTRDRSQADVLASWSDLVRAYQPAIVSYFRRRAGAQDAEDLAQEFLLRCMEEQWWARADSTAGSFRQFLQMLMKRFLAAQMESGYRRFEQVGISSENSLTDAVDQQTPEQYFDLQFLLRLTRIALDELRKDYENEGRGATFSALQPWLVETPGHGELAALGKQTQIAPNTLAVQLKRMRTRLQKAVRLAVNDLSLNAACAATEQHALLSVLSKESINAPE